MAQKYFNVLGLGSVTVDFLGTVSMWPKEGHKLQLDSLGIHDGGLVGTALTAVARLGGRAGFCGKLGFSELAQRALKSFKDEGIDTTQVIRVEGAEPIIALVMANTKNGQRNIFWTRQNVSYPMPDELPDRLWYRRTKVVLIDYESGLAGVRFGEVARKHDIPVVLDIEGKSPLAGCLLGVSTHIIVSVDYARQYTKKQSVPAMLKALRTVPEKTVIITCGPDGCFCSSPQGDFKMGACKIRAVDTTGCGDTFHGAFAVAIAKGKSVCEAAKFASAAAAMCAKEIGGREGIPTLAQLENFMKSHKILCEVL
jgi:sulfofructose kinase